MKKLLAAAVLLTGACAGPKIPDDLPPAPPARTGEPITAPSNAAAEVEEEDGFGGDGFGGEEVAIDVEAAAEEPEEEKADDKKDDAKSDSKDAEKKDGEEKDEPATQPSSEESAK